MSDEKSKALAAALAQIEKNFGKGSIMKMDGSQQEENLDVISTGSLGVDLALGVGGFRPRRVVEIFGPESSGKTTLCLEAIAQCQKNGGICAFIDAEHAFDPDLRPQTRRKSRRTLSLPTGYRRTGIGNLRYIGTLRRYRYGRCRLRSRTCA